MSKKVTKVISQGTKYRQVVEIEDGKSRTIHQQLVGTEWVARLSNKQYNKPRTKTKKGRKK